LPPKTRLFTFSACQRISVQFPASIVSGSAQKLTLASGCGGGGGVSVIVGVIDITGLTVLVGVGVLIPKEIRVSSYSLGSPSLP